MRSLVEIIRENFDLRPAGIIKMLDLTQTDLSARQQHMVTLDATDVATSMGSSLDKVDELKKHL